MSDTPANAAAPGAETRTAPPAGKGPEVVPAEPPRHTPSAMDALPKTTPGAGGGPETRQAKADAKEASDHPVTVPGSPGKRPPLAITTELQEARAKLQAMLDGGPSPAPDTDEVKAQREAVAGAERKLAAEKQKLAALTPVTTVDPAELHAQHYAVRRLENELKETSENAPK